MKLTREEAALRIGMKPREIVAGHRLDANHIVVTTHDGNQLLISPKGVEPFKPGTPRPAWSTAAAPVQAPAETTPPVVQEALRQSSDPAAQVATPTAGDVDGDVDVTQVDETDRITVPPQAPAALPDNAFSDSTGTTPVEAPVVPADLTTVAAIQGWVGDDLDRARAALAQEQAAPSPRTTLVVDLERRLAGETGEPQ